jgi:hypothetical protein
VIASYCYFSKLRKVRKRPAENCRKSIFDKTYTDFNLLKKRDLRSKSRFFGKLSSMFPSVSTSHNTSTENFYSLAYSL